MYPNVIHLKILEYIQPYFIISPFKCSRICKLALLLALLPAFSLASLSMTAKSPVSALRS